jgi:hypothetical protein
MPKKLMAWLFLSLSVLPLPAELPPVFRGFSLTGYSRNAYGNSDDTIRKILVDRYGGRSVVVPVLVTFYVDPATGSVQADRDRTPAVDQTVACLKMIRESGNIPALAFYLDPAVTGQAALTDRRSLKVIDFAQWFKLMEPYLVLAAGSGVPPELIILSPELTGVEFADWSPFLGRIRALLPSVKLAYCTWPWSPLLTTEAVPPWIGRLDYFGSTLILSADSGYLEEYMLNTEITLARINDTARRAGVRPFVAEAGFPSHKRALGQAWTGSAPPEDADPKLQGEILALLVGQLEKSGVSYIFWRIPPAELAGSSALTDFSWFTVRKGNDGTIQFRDKPAAQVVDRVLKAPPQVYRSGVGDPVTLEGNRLVSRRPFGIIKPGGGYDPARSSGIDYKTATERVFTFKLAKPVTRIRYRIAGFSWSGHKDKYDAGQVVIRVQSESQYQNNDGYDRVVSLPWEPAEQSGVWEMGELYDFAPLSRISLRILPSDYGLVIKYLEIILEGEPGNP